MNLTCYCCNAPSTGDDHVPPKSFFPKDGTPRQLIKVPSCAKHNDKQSNADEFLRTLLVGTASNPSPELRDSTVRGLVRLATLMKHPIGRYGLSKDDAGKVRVDPTPTLDWDLMVAGLEKIARGIYFHHHNRKQKLLGDLLVAPHFLGVDPTAEPTGRETLEWLLSETRKDLADLPLLGDHQDIFGYQVLETHGKTVVNMMFFKDRIASVYKMAS